jgi:hypothetical protein
VREVRTREHLGVHLGGIDAGHEQAALQQRETRTAGRAADLDAAVAGFDGQLRPFEGFDDLQIRARDQARRQLDRRHATGPARLGRRSAMPAEPPLERLDKDAVQHELADAGRSVDGRKRARDWPLLDESRANGARELFCVAVEALVARQWLVTLPDVDVPHRLVRQLLCDEAPCFARELDIVGAGHFAERKTPGTREHAA